MSQGTLVKSIGQAVQKLSYQTKSFFLFVLCFILFSLISMTSLFGLSLENQSISPAAFISFQVLSAFLVLWLTLAIYMDCFFPSRDISTQLKEALFGLPRLVIYALVYFLLMFASALLFIFPLLIVGPILYFLPFIAALELEKNNESRLATSFRLIKGRFFSVFLLWFLSLIQAVLIFFVEMIYNIGVNPIVFVTAFFCTAVFSIFFTFWSAYFLKDITQEV